MITTITIKGTKYALINYEEIIRYYQQPSYKKWFTNPPVKELIEIDDIENTKVYNKCSVCDAFMPTPNPSITCDNCDTWFYMGKPYPR